MRQLQKRHMNSTLEDLGNVVQRLSGYLRRRGHRRWDRVLQQNAEWCRQAREAPPLSETALWRVR